MQFGQLRRREFITLIGGAAAAWPLVARAQQPIPVIGFLRSGVADGSVHLVSAFVRGLKEAGFVEGQNVAIEHRFGDDHPDRLPTLAMDLVGRQVAVIVANQAAAQAAKAVTTAVPIVFVTGADPVRVGLVGSLNRPAGNVTGVVFTTGELAAKRLGLLHELVPNAFVIGVLLARSGPATDEVLSGVEEARRIIGRQFKIVMAAREHELDAAFESIVQARAGALLVGGGPLFLGQRRQLVALAARHALPANYAVRQYPEAGGLMSYGPSMTDAYRLAGGYAARILKGAKPGDLPVEQATKFELVLNLKTAKALGLEIPPTLLARADEVIE
jgi:putative ABC transport system substrate-binding protein